MEKTANDLSPEIKEILRLHEEEKVKNKSLCMSKEYEKFAELAEGYEKHFKDSSFDKDENNLLLEMLLERRKELFNEDETTLELLKQNTKRIYRF